MEKVTVTGAFQKGLTKKGNPYYGLTLADGRQATCFDKEILTKLNQEIEVEMRQDEKYDGYVLNLPGNGFQKRGGGGFNLDFNQRKTALECAVATLNGKVENGKEITDRADYLLSWLKGGAQ